MAKFLNEPLMYGIIIAVIAIIVIGSFAGYTLLNPVAPTPSPSPSATATPAPTPTATPSPTEVTDQTQRQIRNETMATFRKPP
jgi:hypothetical protein